MTHDVDLPEWRSTAEHSDVPTVVHISPHPDDEALGAPVLLQQLVDQGWRVINLLLSLGRPGDENRRRREAELAAHRAGLELHVLEPRARLSAADDVVETQRILVEQLAAVVADPIDLFVSPSPHDGHHGHETAARALRDAIECSQRPARWWMWGLWADLPIPTLYLPYGEDLQRRSDLLVAAYAGELSRNDYRHLLHGRGRVNAVLGSERVFGFGASAVSLEPFAELLTEVVFDGARWCIGQPRVLDTTKPFEPPTGEVLNWWLHAPSLRATRDQSDRSQDPSAPTQGATYDSRL
jgi:LmbE family N-acetylglucosaminyl deacetylase